MKGPGWMAVSLRVARSPSAKSSTSPVTRKLARAASASASTCRSEADGAVKRSGPDPAGQSSRSTRFPQIGDREGGAAHVTIGFRLDVRAPRDGQAALVRAGQQEGPGDGP